MPFLKGDDRQSMLEKSFERRRVNKEHNSNFRAGHVAVHEEHLHKTGLRGRKGHIAVCFLFCIVAVAITNLLLTMCLFIGIHVDHTGSSILAFLDRGVVQLKLPTTFENQLRIHDGLRGYHLQDLKFVTIGSDICLNHSSSSGSRVKISSSQTSLKSKMPFTVINPKSRKSVFNLDNLVNLKLMPDVRVTSQNRIETNKIVSPLGLNLKLTSQKTLTLKGIEGLTLRSPTLDIRGKNISFYSTSSIILRSPKSGIYLNSSSLRWSPEQPTNVPRTKTFKLCVCENSGRVFKVEVQPGSVHPCNELSAEFALC